MDTFRLPLLDTENISDVYARGAESSFNFSGKLGKISYKFLSAYSLTKTTIESPVAKTEGFAGTQLIYIPLHSVNGLVYATFKGYFASWSANFIGQRTTTMDAEKITPTHCLPIGCIIYLLGKTFL